MSIRGQGVPTNTIKVGPIQIQMIPQYRYTLYIYVRFYDYLPQNVEYRTGQKTKVHRETEILNLVLNWTDLAVHQRHCIHNTTYKIRSQVKVSPRLIDTNCTCIMI